MTVTDTLTGVNRLFLDTAPVIYFVEQNPAYAARVNDIFDLVDAGVPVAVSSSITLAEALIIPYRLGLAQLKQDFLDLLVYGHGAMCVAIGPNEAQQAAELRALYNLSLTDAFQVACALGAGCEAILTNDHQFRQITEIRTIILDDIT